MTKLLQSRRFRQLSLKGVAVRVFGLALFTWATVYNPIHLLIEQHWDDIVADSAQHHQATIASEDLDHSHATHRVHAASDHKMRLACPSLTSPQSTLFLPSILPVLNVPTPCFIKLFLVERVNPPGSRFAEPLLARPPPAV